MSKKEKLYSLDELNEFLNHVAKELFDLAKPINGSEAFLTQLEEYFQ